MSLSLRDQLIQAGLGTKKQGKQVEQQQRKQQHREAKGNAPPSAGQTQAAQQAHAAKIARTQELNRQRQAQAENKARWAQIKQLIEQNRLPKIEGEDYIAFNFIDRQKVRRIAVDAQRRDRLTRGELFIVRCDNRYDVVPTAVAERIREREPRAVVSLEAKTPQVAQDDQYKDFVVPDDLMW